MKFLLCSDVHLDGKCPANRTDNFFETQTRKIKELIHISLDCTAILQAGDLTNGPLVGNEVVSMLLTNLRQTGASLYTVLGQHDMLFRSRENLFYTALGVMNSANLVHILGDIPVVYNDEVYIYGCSWGDPVPVPPKGNGHSILVIHASIGDKKLFPTMEMIQAKKFLIENKFDLILTGDYHYPFHIKVKNKITGRERQIVNTGVLIRRKIDEKDIIPRVGIYDTETRSIEWRRILTEPNVFKDVLKMKKDDVGRMADKILINLECSKTLSSDYKETVLEFIKVNFKDIKASVRELILELLNEAEESVSEKG